MNIRIKKGTKTKRMSMSKKIAKFKCLKCGHKWNDITGPTQCPVCGHLYVKWLNYEQIGQSMEEEV